MPDTTTPHPDQPAPSTATPGDDVRIAWSVAAREVLTATAGRYHGLTTYRELASEVQDRSGLHTTKLAHHWIGDVLQRVSTECHDRGEPDLSSLCVNAQGSVGPGYAAGLRTRTGEEPADTDAHAALARLECYRAARASGLPDDGGRPALSEKLQAARSRARVVAARDRPAVICPTCRMAKLPNGVCDTCD